MDVLKEAFVRLTEASVLMIDFVALLVIVFSTLEAFVGAARVAILQDRRSFHKIWLRYARWLVAALTFQLAADIIEASITEDWESIGRIAAVAVIRTFLNYFLDRDVAETRERRDEAMSEKG